MSTFTYAGTSMCKGQFKVRFANDAMRVKVLAKTGHTEIDLIELPDAMTKEQAVAYLTKIAFWDKNGVINAEVRAAIEADQVKREPKAAAKDKPKKETKKPKKEAPAKAITLDTIKAKTPKTVQPNLEDLEEAPF